jgi:hypothetical protein
MVDHASRHHRRMGIGGLCGVGAGMMDKHTPKLLDCIPTMRMSLASRDMLAALEAMRDNPTIAAVCPSPLWAQMVDAILKARGETA